MIIFFIQSLKNRAAKPIEIFLHGVLFFITGVFKTIYNFNIIINMQVKVEHKAAVN